MKIFSVLLVMFAVNFAVAENNLKMYYKNEDIAKIIETYSKASGQKFIVDPAVRGKISIFLQQSVSVEEAFNHLSSALAINGYAISKQGDTMIVKTARNIQRDLIEVSSEKPSMKPERMYTWVYQVKNIPAEGINRDLRILTSKDGEMVTLANTNQLFITDWTSNLNRIAAIVTQIDIPVDAATAKIVEAAKKEEARNKSQNGKKTEDN